MTPFGSTGGTLARLAFLAALRRWVRLYVRLLADPRVPLFPKLIVVGALVYLIAPVDLVPDYLVPVVGHLDDVAVLWVAVRALVRLSPPDVVAEHRRSAAG